MERKIAADGSTFYGAIIGVPGIGEGVAFRPDRQTPEEFAALGDTPYVAAADRVLEEHDWALHGNLQGIVAEAGGSNSHGAVVAREQGIPCVVNAAGVRNINPGDHVWLDSDSGEIRVNGGGPSGPQGEGDPIKTFVWFNHSFMVSDTGQQNHEEMVRYMSSFGLWGAMGTMGILYDNGYAQVDQLPPNDEAEALGRVLSRVSGTTLPEIGTAEPTRGKREVAPGAEAPQAPMQAAIDVARFIWTPGHFDWREVNPNDPNDPATTHQTMIDEYNARQGDEYAWYMVGFQNQGVMGIVYDNGLAEVYTQSGPPAEQAELEQEVKASIPGVNEFKYMTGGLILGAKVADDGKATRCPECDSHTLRGEGLETDDPKLHCLNCGNIFSPDGITAEKGNKVIASKLDKGQRVEITHPKLKGQKGTILEHSGKDEAFDEELYNILLDNGEELEDVPDTAFKKIRSAAVDPHFLYSGIEKEALDLGDTLFTILGTLGFSGFVRYLIENYRMSRQDAERKATEMMSFMDQNGPIESPSPYSRSSRAKPLPEDVLTGIDGGRLGQGYEGHPVMCYMCGNERTANLGTQCGTCGYVLTIRRDGPPKNDAPPMWRTSTVLAQDGTPRSYSVGSEINGNQQISHMYEVGSPTTVCGLQVNSLQQPNHSRTFQNLPCPTCFGNRVAGIKLADTDGDDLQPGLWYTMYSEKYTVPDVIQIIEIDPETQNITAHIEGDDKGVFPLAITPEERTRNGYRFERYEKTADFLDSIKLARRNFSVQEQNALINENMGARARNFHKVNIDGTHYDPNLLNEDAEKDSFFTIDPDSPISKHFLW